MLVLHPFLMVHAMVARHYFAVSLVLIGLLWANSGKAHVPHDVVSDIAVHGQSAGTFVRGALFLSTDGGQSWHRRSARIVCRTDEDDATHAIAFSPDFERDKSIYLSCDEWIFASRDAGKSFQKMGRASDRPVVQLGISARMQAGQILTALDNTGTLHRSADGGRVWSPVDLPATIDAFEWVGHTILAATAEGGIHQSSDGAVTWQALGDLPGGTRITDFAFPYGEDLERAFWVSTRANGLYKFARRGGTLLSLNAYLPGRHITSVIHTGPADGKALIATDWHDGVFRSDDYGQTWRPLSAGLQTASQADRLGHPHFVEVAASGGDTLLLAGFAGLFRSVDGGAQWRRMDTTHGQIVAMDASPAMDGRFRLGVVSYGSGLLFSDDGGETWRFEHKGLIHVRRHSLVFSPDYPQDHTLFSGTMKLIAHTSNASHRWRPVSIDTVPGVKAQAPQVLPIRIAVSPDFAADGTVFSGLVPQGVIRSQDRGQTFEMVLDEPGLTFGLEISPDFAADGTVFAGSNKAVHKSMDRGDTWTRVWAHDADRIALAISPDYPTDQTVFAGSEAGLFWTRDGGRSWEPIRIEGATETVATFAVSPDFARDGRLLVQLAGADLLVGRLSGKAFQWQAARMPSPGYAVDRLAHYDGSKLFAFSPFYASDRTVFTASGPDLLKSVDGGLTWALMDPLPRRHEAEYAHTDWFHVPIAADRLWEKSRWQRSTWQTLYGKAETLWAYLSGADHPRQPNDSSLQSLRSRTPGATITLDFSGTGVRWLGSKGYNHGIARVLLDGKLVGEVDQYARQRDYLAEMIHLEGLAPGHHTLEIRVVDKRNTASSGQWVDVDAFDVFR